MPNTRNQALITGLLGGALALTGCSGSGGGSGSSASTAASTTKPGTTPTGTTPTPTPSTQPAPAPSPAPVPGQAPAPIPLPSGSVGGPYAQGVDVSVWDSTVSWTKASAAGLSFAIARVSDGTQTPDATFAPNWTGMKAQGMVRGVYQYFRASESATAQADYLIAQVTANGGFQAGDLPPCLDIETLDGVSASTVVTGITAWMTEIRTKTGLNPIVYCANSFWNSLNPPALDGTDDVWVANWAVTSPAMPGTWPTWTFWQYADNGTVNGVGSGTCDMDQFQGTVADLQAYAGLTPAPGFYRGLSVDSTGQGYFLVANDGGVFPYGDATFHGAAAGQALPQPVLSIVRTPTGYGYWLVGADGNVYPFGDAAANGNLAGSAIPAPIIGLASTPSGNGYWLAGQDGTVTAFGDALNQVTVAGATFTGQVVAIAATPTGKGLWLASHDGNVYAFGDAINEGSLAGQPLVKAVVGMAATPTGKGYWLACADGTVQNFGDAPAFTYAGTKTLSATATVTAITSSLTGKGFWLTVDDGTVFAFGDAIDGGTRAR